jgi:hypothetical protein
MGGSRLSPGRRKKAARTSIYSMRVKVPGLPGHPFRE